MQRPVRVGYMFINTKHIKAVQIFPLEKSVQQKYFLCAISSFSLRVSGVTFVRCSAVMEEE